MTANYQDYNAAVKASWAGRDLQTQRQIDSGKIDAGTRGSVTGGQHLNALQELIAGEFTPLARLGATVRWKGKIPIPGYYRRTKNWDIVVTYQNLLIAAIECKSQVGSVSNNFNNRSEEIIGNAVDLWRAYKAGLVGKIEPWLGFVLVFEHTAQSEHPVHDQGKPVYETDPAFNDSSYTDRYRLLFQRLLQDGLYNAACLITTVKGNGIYSEPQPEISTANLTAAIADRVAYVRSRM